MDAPRRRRVEQLKSRMAEAGVDAYLTLHPPHLFYLSGFTGESGALLLGADGATLFTDGRFAVQARAEVDSARVRAERRSLLDAVGAQLCRRRMRVAFEAAHLAVAQKARVQRAAGPRVRWTGVSGWVERLRAVKDEQEIAALREAARLVSRVFTEVLPLVRAGTQEVELAAEVEYRMRRRGAAGPSFETIVASGPRAALPHARPSARALRGNELVVLDMGVILRGYCSDMTRSVYLGRAPQRVRRWYHAVLEAQAAAREALRPGVRAQDVDAAARKVLRRFGLERRFVHSTGHGLGLEIHEDPRLGRGERAFLQAGNVVTLEPGVYVEGTGGIRVEDDLVLLPRGAETLTTAPRDFLEL